MNDYSPPPLDNGRASSPGLQPRPRPKLNRQIEQQPAADARSGMKRVRLRTFLLVAVPLAMPIAFMLFVVRYQHQKSLFEITRRKADMLTTIFAINAAAPMAFDDSKALDALLLTSTKDPDVVYVVASSSEGRQLASHGDVQVRPKVGVRSLESWEDRGMIHVAAPVKGQHDATIGVLQVGFNTQPILEEARSFRALAIILSIVVLVVAGLMALLLGRDFSRLFEQLRGSILETARSVEEVVTQLAAVTSEQTAAASEESSALHESNATAGEVGQAATAAAQRATALIDGGGRAEESAAAGLQSVASATTSLHTITTTIGALSERAAAIGDIASTVAMLAERSNLLALNAAIEAARAGAQGRGFSVVAQEMRSLADGSNRSAAQVKSIIAEIQGAISRAVSEVREGERRVGKTEQLAEQLGDSIRKFADATRQFALVGKEIAASANQQSVAIEQVVESIAHATEAGGTQLETTQRVEETTRQLRELSRQMLEVTSGRGRGIGDLSAGGRG